MSDTQNMELIVLENVNRFSWNFEPVKQSLEQHIQQYANLVVTEDNLKDMEKTQKEIASLRTKLGKFRLEVKREMEKPYGEFELQVKQLLSLVESAEKPIKDQIDKYEVQRRSEKALMVRQMIYEVADDHGLESKYTDQIVVADKHLNRTTTKKEISDDVFERVRYFLGIQAQEREAATFREQKIEMAQFMCEKLSAGLATPLCYSEIENRIDSMDIGTLRTFIENEVARRKEREERAAQMAIEKAEREKQAEIERLERIRLAGEERARKAAEKQSVVSVEPDPLPSPVSKPLYKAQFVAYDVTDDQISEIKGFMALSGIKFEHAVKPAGK